MNRLFFKIVLTALLIGIPICTASAGFKPTTHSGFYVGLGIGGGGLKLKTDLADDDFTINSDSETGIAANFRIGFAVSNRVLLGIEGNTWSREYKEANDIYELNWQLLLGNATLAVTYYPTDRFFVKGGPSIGVTSIEVDSPAFNLGYKDNASGFGFMLGAGWELRLTNRFAVVPSAQWILQEVKTDEFEHLQSNADNVSANYFSITINASWFW